MQLYTRRVKSNSTLLVFNFAMDPNDPLLSHQYEAVLALANEFKSITVITGREGNVPLIPNIRIITSDWKPGKRLRNLFKLFVKAVPVILRGDFKSVFFHMTDLQCAFLSPIIWLRRRRQFLWYAHTFKSRYLVCASWWVTGVVTSTVGSCPLVGRKVMPIGQAIDPVLFKPVATSKLDFDKLVHIGRFDKSKNIDVLISSAGELKNSFPGLNLKIVGSPANPESSLWARDLIDKNWDKVESGWLSFKESIPRNQFPEEMARNGCFFHGYVGSLDKTLIESTMLRVPVITTNPEYTYIFGTWAKSTHPNLASEYRALRSHSPDEISLELDRRLDLAILHHSLQNWIEQLTKILR